MTAYIIKRRINFFALAWLFALLSAANGYAQSYTYANHTEAGIMVGTLGGLPVNFQTFNGIRFKKLQLEAGLTIGIDSYQQIVLVPVAAGLRCYLNHAKTAPYFGMDAGYSFDWVEKETSDLKFGGGYMLNPVVGLRFGNLKPNKTTLSVGYRHQLASAEEGFNQLYTTKREYSFNRITIRFGLSY
ncbi:MAG: hypothetical protein H7Y13_03160 [Sphingobacteriaceae bacterium]|nr:hypothetical protein [Sphingobacteriaceae bacterium]